VYISSSIGFFPFHFARIPVKISKNDVDGEPNVHVLILGHLVGFQLACYTFTKLIRVTWKLAKKSTFQFLYGGMLQSMIVSATITLNYSYQ